MTNDVQRDQRLACANRIRVWGGLVMQPSSGPGRRKGAVPSLMIAVVALVIAALSLIVAVLAFSRSGDDNTVATQSQSTSPTSQAPTVTPVETSVAPVP